MRGELSAEESIGSVSRDRKLQEISGLVIICFSAIFLLSIASFSSGDIKSLSSGGRIANLIGPAGAYVSASVRALFGISSYIIPLILLIAGFSLFKDRGFIGQLEKISALFLFLAGFAALVSVFSNEIHEYSGGAAGFYIYKYLRAGLGSTGACLIIILLNISALILFGAVSADSISSFFRGRAVMKLKSLIKKITVSGIESGEETVSGAADKLPHEAISGKRLAWIIKKKVRVYAGSSEKTPPCHDAEDIMYIGMSEALKEKIEGFKYGKVSEYSHESPALNVNLVKPGVPAFYDEANSREIYCEKDNPVYDEYCDDDCLPEEFEDELRFENKLNLLSGAPECRVPMETAVSPAINRIRLIRPLNENSPGFIEDEEDDCPDVQDAGPSAECAAGEEFSSGESISAGSLHPAENDDSDEESMPENESGEIRKINISENYSIPAEIFSSRVPLDSESWKNEIIRNSQLLTKTLEDFGIEAKVIKVNRGPVITLYELQIASGIKVNRVVGLSDDIAMALAALRVRIVAPIPGKSAIGIEIPNIEREVVTLGDVLKTPEYKTMKANLKVALGQDILGNPVLLDLKKMPHLLIAGATGSGKSVCVNTIITSLVYNYNPNHVRFILIDPKMVELQLYNGLPHLLTPVITEPQIAPSALKWAIYEMERRYKLLSDFNAREIGRYNSKVEYIEKGEHLPFIVIIIDELADLMMVAPKEIEGYITRVAQKARAVGIHMVLATQRPSVDVITGVIKANFPARIAFQVAQKTDSRTILDQNGAEKLLGQGDMLYQSPLSSYPVRIQGAFISEEEIESTIRHLSGLGSPEYVNLEEAVLHDGEGDMEGDEDELFIEALKIVEDTKKASASYLQRKLSIGYNRAARIIELMEERGYIGPQFGSKPREVFI